MASLLRAALFAASVTNVAACAYGTTLMPRAEDGAVTVNTFGYSGSIGPVNWHNMNTTTNGLCASGTNQSPIDLTGDAFTAAGSSALSLRLPDFTAGATFENLGTTVEVVGEGGNLTLASKGNKTFEFAQFHFHLPSEHLDNGTSMALEVHFVFQAADSELAVVGVMIDVDDTESEASGFLATVFASAGAIATPGTKTTTQAFSLSAFVDLISKTTFRTYSGSLTTPPCSEGVNWFVATDTLSVSLNTYKVARDVIGFNSRTVQNKPGAENIIKFAASAM